MNFLPEEIENYSQQYTTAEDNVLEELNRETYARILMPQMLSGHLQGQFLRMISKLIRPQNILEIGTFTGYSAICLSAGLQDNGTLYTIDTNEELKETTEKYLSKAGIANRVKFLIGKAVEIIPLLNVVFDLVYIDADKQNYSRYYDMVFDKVNSGGLILADNVLWSGKVVRNEPDEETQALIAFNNKIKSDPRIEHILLPLRDGVMMIRKK
ncbi:MAG: O-methyltransferase [Chitinophagales bacterium]|nr:O-methyltransferase [Chitinophagales bacterium]